MFNRRDFIKQTSLLTAGLVISKSDWFTAPRPIGVQLFTLRAEMDKDPVATLEKVAKLGYTQVETYGYKDGKWFGLNATELAAVLKKNGLTSPSGHTFTGGYFLKEGWEDGWKQAVKDARAIGQKFIVVPWLEQDLRSPDAYKKLAAALNKAGTISKNLGVKLAYHNHDFEFYNVDGQTGFEILAALTNRSLVYFELDLYWATKAGKDPLKLFAKHSGRIAMWHVKDMDNTPNKAFTEVGNGVIDFKAIFKKSAQSGMQYFFVEQDETPGSPLDSIEKSIQYLKANIVK